MRRYAWPRICRLLLPFIAITCMLQACASGPRFDEVQASLQEVPQDKARIILFRQWRYVGSLVSNDIKVDGKVIGTLSNASFLIAEHAAGDVQITMVNDFITKDFVFSFKVKDGKTYYIEFESNGSMEVPLPGGGFVPLTFYANVRQFCGPGWCAGIEPPAEALPKLNSLTRGSPP